MKNLYLDNSDLMNLYRDDLDPRKQDQKRRLLSLLDQGKIEIGLSFPLVFEFLQDYDQRHKADRLRRAAFLSMISRGKSHPHIQDLLSGHTFPNNGLFAPLSETKFLTAKKIRAQFKTLIENRIRNRDQKLPRRVRRQLTSKKGFANLFSDTENLKLTKDDYEGIPVTDEFIKGRYVERLFEGNITEPAFNRAIQKWLYDPITFCQFWYEFAKLDNPIIQLQEKHYANLVAGLDKFIEAKRALNKSKETANALYREHTNQLRKADLPHWIKSEFRLEKPPSNPDINLDIGAIEIFGPIRSQTFNAYVNWAMKNPSGRSPSDLADLMHLIYLPDVDIMRTDKKMASIMCSARVPGFEKIFSSLDSALNDAMKE